MAMALRSIGRSVRVAQRGGRVVAARQWLVTVVVDAQLWVPAQERALATGEHDAAEPLVEFGDAGDVTVLGRPADPFTVVEARGTKMINAMSASARAPTTTSSSWSCVSV